MPTKTEHTIRHKRTRSGILVPIIEDFMRKPVNVEFQEDVEFLADLAQKMAMRESERENGAPVYSPSALASCLRYVYLQRHGHDLGVSRLEVVRPEAVSFFLKGNFVHLQWQFVFHKMFQAKVDGIAPLEVDSVNPRWCEFRILSKHGDHGGTVDIGIRLNDEPTLIDVKGVNVRTFGEATRGFAPANYEIQLTDYMMLYNSLPTTEEKITNSILLFENKGGPDARHPVALHEHPVRLKKNKPEVRRRLEVLREHEAAEEIPPPECTGTGTFQFVGCPFRKFCKKEVEKIQNKQRKLDGGPSTYKIATPKGKRRKRR